jgi:hypothetical protein
MTDERKQAEASSKVRQILQDYHRRDDYSLESAESDILSLFKVAEAMPTEEDRQFCEEIKVIAISNYAADIPRLIIRLFRTRMSKPNTGGEG